MSNNYLIYRHISSDTGNVFYVGIGCSKYRPYSKSGRNKYWHNIVNKHGYYVQILATNLSKDDACELEELLIQTYGRRDLGTWILVNMTNGGEGTNKMSIESIKQRSDKLRKYKLSEERKQYLREIFKGRYVSEETRLKQSMSKKGKNNPFYNCKHSDMTKKKMSECRQGNLNPKSKIVINTENGFFYETIQEASEIYNINKVTLADYLRGKRKNKTLLISI